MSKYAVNDGTKLCNTCHQILPVDQFTVNKKSGSGLEYWCKGCAIDRRLKYTKPGKHFMSKYGISYDQYLVMLKNQGGVCAICKQYSIGFRGDALVVDHCHETGKVRGLLCSKCNTGIGHLKDDPDLLRAAIAYLEN